MDRPRKDDRGAEPRLASGDIAMLLTVLTLLGMLLAVAGFWPFDGHVAKLSTAIGVWVVYLAGGLPAAWRALSTLWKERVLDIDLLMVVAAVAAAAVGAPFEGAVLLTLFSVSTTLEERALGRARRAIEALMALRPETALRKTSDGTVTEVPAADLKVNDIVVLRPGARVPADGVIISGHGSLDEANITGESMPVEKIPGAQVFEATVNLDGVLEVAVSKTVEESTVARMIALVTKAQAAKAPSERFSAWFGQRYTVAVMAGAMLAFAAFYWLGRDWEEALYQGRDPAGGRQSLCDRHLRSGGHSVGAVCCRAGRRAVQRWSCPRNTRRRRHFRLRQDRNADDRQGGCHPHRGARRRRGALPFASWQGSKHSPSITVPQPFGRRLQAAASQSPR